MTKKEFKEKLGKEIRKNLPNVILEETKLQKNNGPVEAIMVKIKGTPYGLAVRYAETYQTIVNGCDPKLAIYQIVEDLKNRIDDIDNSEVKNSERLLTDYAFVKSHIRPVLVNKDKNKDLVLKELCGDLAIGFKIYLNDEMSIRVTKSIEDRWKSIWKEGVSDFYTSAFKNEKQVPELYAPLDDVIRKAGIPLPDDANINVYIISNKKTCWGAIKLLTSKAVKEMAARLGGCYIIPSSVHECIILPKTEHDDITKDMNEFISMVNANEVRPDEVLSDCLYFMDEYGRITLV